MMQSMKIRQVNESDHPACRFDQIIAGGVSGLDVDVDVDVDPGGLNGGKCWSHVLDLSTWYHLARGLGLDGVPRMAHDT